MNGKEPSPLASASSSTGRLKYLLNRDQAGPAADRRARHRVACEGLFCSLGRVVDISGTGMRVVARGRCRVKKDDRLKLTVGYSDQNLALTAKVVRVRKIGFLKYESGLLFENVSEQQSSILCRLAQIAMPKSLMGRRLLKDLPTNLQAD